MKKYLLTLLAAASLSTASTQAQTPWTSARPDGHAPISVMGDHTHKKGEWMFSYRLMNMQMKGVLKGSDDLSQDEVHDKYMVSPEKMSMNMHMLGMMYAPSDRVTLAVMANYLSNDMDLVSKMKMMDMPMHDHDMTNHDHHNMEMTKNFSTSSSGFGDLSVAALVSILNSNSQALHANIGLSVPTGSIDARDKTPMSGDSDVRLAYPMQLGSGTWDPSVGLTYLKQFGDKLSWNLQSTYKFRLGENVQEYRLGNELKASTWTAYNVNKLLSFSLGLNYKQSEKISGADDEMNPMMMPAFGTENSGRKQLDLGLGANFYLPNGTLKNLRVGFEYDLPVYQHVNGIQMKNEAMFTLGLQYALGGHH